MDLDSRQRQYLKGLAHHLKPVVHVGKDGLTPALLRQIDVALLSHELIKVKLAEGAPVGRKEAAAELPARTGAALVQNVGRVLVLFRRHPEEPKIDLPAPRRDAAAEEAYAGMPRSVRRRGEAAAPPPPAPEPSARRPVAPARHRPSGPGRPRGSEGRRRGRGRPR